MNDQPKPGPSPVSRVDILAAMAVLAAALSLLFPCRANLSRLRTESRELEKRISSLRIPAPPPAGGSKARARPGAEAEAETMRETIVKAMPETRGAASPYEAASLLKTRLSGFGFNPEPSIRVESSGGIYLESSAPDAEPLSLALREIAERSFPAAITGLSFRLEENGALTMKLEAIHAR